MNSIGSAYSAKKLTVYYDAEIGLLLKVTGSFDSWSDDKKISSASFTLFLIETNVETWKTSTHRI